MGQLKVKTGVGGLVAFHTQTHPPSLPASQPRVDERVLRQLPRCTGWGRGGLQNAPEQRRLRGPEPEVTCCFQGRLRKTGEGFGRKWCCSSLGNQFVPPLIGQPASPLWESPAKGLPGPSNSVSHWPQFLTFPCLCSFNGPCPDSPCAPCNVSLPSCFGLARPSTQPSFVIRLQAEPSPAPLLGDFFLPRDLGYTLPPLPACQSLQG